MLVQPSGWYSVAMQTLKKLYARLDALCRARPKTVAAAIMVFAAAAFLANPAWPWPGFAWVAGAMLLPGVYIVLLGLWQSRSKSKP